MMTHIVTRDEKPLTASVLFGWLAKAEPGDAVEYHRGFLARDIIGHASRLSEHDRVELARLARSVWWASEQNLIHLVQRRHGPNDYSYLRSRVRDRTRHCPRCRRCCSRRSRDDVPSTPLLHP